MARPASCDATVVFSGGHKLVGAVFSPIQNGCLPKNNTSTYIDEWKTIKGKLSKHLFKANTAHPHSLVVAYLSG